MHQPQRIGHSRLHQYRTGPQRTARARRVLAQWLIREQRRQRPRKR